MVSTPRAVTAIRVSLMLCRKARVRLLGSMYAPLGLQWRRRDGDRTLGAVEDRARVTYRIRSIDRHSYGVAVSGDQDPVRRGLASLTVSLRPSQS